MSVNPPEGTLTIENSHLDVKGNVSAVALKLGTLRLTPSYGLDAVANVSNSTTHTLELSNATTGLVTTANVVVGKDLAVSGNATVSSNLTVSGNATVSSNLTVGGDATVTGNATMTSNLTVSGDATVSSNLTVTGDATMSSNLEVGTANLFVNTTTGRVGIGEVSPTQLIHARGTGPQLFIEGATNENAVIRGSSGPSYRDKYHEISMGFYALPTFGTSNYIDFKVNEGGESNSPSTRMRIRGDGNVGIGITNPPETLTVQHTNIAPSFGLRRGTYGDYVVLMKHTNGSFSTVNTSNDAVLLVGKGSSTNRSINALGTVNANGTDYAEYMKKSRSGLHIKKGDIIGINNDGELTNVFSESIQFVVKSTNPSYVGGDSWNQGTIDAPKYPSVMLRVDEYSNISSQDANLYTYWEEQNLYANTEQLNVYYEENEKYLEDRNLHRDPYDRIAFCGQVPVNVYNATPGQYVIPKQTDDDTISYELTNTPTFEQYQISIGKVIKIQEDGRAFIIVKIS